MRGVQQHIPFPADRQTYGTVFIVALWLFIFAIRESRIANRHRDSPFSSMTSAQHRGASAKGNLARLHSTGFCRDELFDDGCIDLCMWIRGLEIDDCLGGTHLLHLGERNYLLRALRYSVDERDIHRNFEQPAGGPLRRPEHASNNSGRVWIRCWRRRGSNCQSAQ